mmetsp:Transcript_87992/g.249289  ORF Transcript_87992/g.249289 Transcript_87992/m.249289 type:complete len:228 (+) Transcript_87992:497-1180(+)
MTPRLPWERNSMWWWWWLDGIVSRLAPSTMRTGPQPQASKSFCMEAIASSTFTPKTSRWMGSKVMPGSWTLMSSTSACRAGCVAGSAPFSFSSSQHLLAVAREWFPSPTGKRITPWSGLAAYFSRKRCGSASDRRALTMPSTALAAATCQPFRCPLPFMSSKSYSFSKPSFCATRGSITVLSGSSISTRMWGSSSGACSRMAMRGGSRSGIVFSVGRIRLWEPFSKL